MGEVISFGDKNKEIIDRREQKKATLKVILEAFHAFSTRSPAHTVLAFIIVHARPEKIQKEERFAGAGRLERSRFADWAADSIDEKLTFWLDGAMGIGNFFPMHEKDLAIASVELKRRLTTLDGKKSEDLDTRLQLALEGVETAVRKSGDESVRTFQIAEHARIQTNRWREFLATGGVSTPDPIFGSDIAGAMTDVMLDVIANTRKPGEESR